MIEPPKFENAGQLFTWMLALTFLAVLGVLTKRLGMDQRQEPPSTPERVQVERAAGISTAGVSDETVALVARLYADLDELRRERDEDRRFLAKLDDHIDQMILGHTQGIYPPWPKKPTRTGSTAI